MGNYQKILMISDLHLQSRGRKIIGLDPVVRFQECLSHAARHHCDADRMIFLGDLTHDGSPGAYRILRDLIADAPWPVTFLLGNHDRRSNFLAQFPDTPTTPTGFVQDVYDTPQYRLISLDTLDEDAPDRHSGLLCAERLEWLDHALQTANSRRVILFLHHPPFESGFDGMDAIKLRNADALYQILERHSPVGLMIAGHIHRSMSGVCKGIPFKVFKSTCHQMPMLLDQSGSGHSVDEPGAYGILLLKDAGPVVHTEDFALANQDVSLDHTSA